MYPYPGRKPKDNQEWIALLNDELRQMNNKEKYNEIEMSMQYIKQFLNETLVTVSEGEETIVINGGKDKFIPSLPGFVTNSIELQGNTINNVLKDKYTWTYSNISGNGKMVNGDDYFELIAGPNALWRVNYMVALVDDTICERLESNTKYNLRFIASNSANIPITFNIGIQKPNGQGQMAQKTYALEMAPGFSGVVNIPLQTISQMPVNNSTDKTYIYMAIGGNRTMPANTTIRFEKFFMTKGEASIITQERVTNIISTGMNNEIHLTFSGKNFINKFKSKIGVVEGYPLNYNWTSGDDLIQIVPGQSYNISNNSKPVNMYIEYYDEKKLLRNKIFNSTFVAPFYCYYIRLVSENKNNNRLQMEEGLNPTVFERYREIKRTAILKEPLRRTSNTAYDKMVLRKGKYMIERHIGKKVLNGTESWNIASSYTTTNTFMFATSVINAQKFNGNMVSDKFVCNYYNKEDKDCISGWGGSDGTILFKIQRERVNNDTNGNALKNYLKSNPIIVLYELKDVYYEEPEYDLSIDYTLFEGINRVSVDDKVPCNVNINIAASFLSSIYASLDKFAYRIQKHGFTTNKDLYFLESVLSFTNTTKASSISTKSVGSTGAYNLNLEINDIMLTKLYIGPDNIYLKSTNPLTFKNGNDGITYTGDKLVPLQNNTINLGTLNKPFHSVTLGGVEYYGALATIPDMTNQYTIGSTYYNTRLKRPQQWNGSEWGDL